MSIALSGLSAIIVAYVGPLLVAVLRWMSHQSAKEVGFIRAGLSASVFTALFRILAVSCFGLFFATSRFGNETGRVIFFWISTVLILTPGCGLFSADCVYVAGFQERLTTTHFP